MSFDAGLTRKGPGLLVRDLMRGEDPQIEAVIHRITTLKPDILAMQSVDYDYDSIAASILKDALAKAGHAMPHHYLAAPNTGVPTGFDLDRNNRFGEARDAQGYGTFRGQGGLLLLSRFPILSNQSVNHTSRLWAYAPDAVLPAGYFTTEETEVIRLHSVAAWDVPIQMPSGILHILMSKAGPPVFDGPEDRNGLRNANEITFWSEYIKHIDAPFVIMAGLNNDPDEGEGLKPAINALLRSPQITDPKPRSSAFGMATVNWDFGKLRVDYILPSRRLEVKASGVDWLAAETDAAYGSRHRPIWVDIAWQ